MKAAVFKEKQDVSIENVPVPQIEKGQVLVETTACGLCGTDRHIFQGEAPAEPPLIMGHEISGRVQETGSAISGLSPGTKAAVDPNINCGHCYHCHRGEINLCENLQAVGVTRDGGFAEYVAVPRENIYTLSEDTDLSLASLVEPLACCLHGMDLVDIAAGSRVLILGGGAIGLILAQLAKITGARTVVVSEPEPVRRKIATEIGLPSVVHPDHLSDFLDKERINKIDTVIEAVGRMDTFRQALKYARHGGQVLVFGVSPQKAVTEVSPFAIYEKELTIQGSYVNPFVTEQAVNLLESGDLNLEQLITTEVQLEEVPEIISTPPGPRDLKTIITF